MGNRTPPRVRHEVAGLVVAAGAGARGARGRAGRGHPLSGCGAAGCAAPATGTCARTASSSACTPTARSPTSCARRPRAPGRPAWRVGPGRRAVEPLANGVTPSGWARLGRGRARRRARLRDDRARDAAGRAARGDRHVAVLEPQPSGASGPPRSARTRRTASRRKRSRRFGPPATGSGRPRARRRRRAGDAARGARAAAPRGARGVRRAGRRRHDARLPRRRAHPAPHPGFLRLHDRRLRPGPLVADQGRASLGDLAACGRWRTGPTRSPGWQAGRRRPRSRSSSPAPAGRHEALSTDGRARRRRLERHRARHRAAPSPTPARTCTPPRGGRSDRGGGGDPVIAHPLDITDRDAVAALAADDREAAGHVVVAAA